MTDLIERAAVLALIDAVVAEPAGRNKVWLSEPSASRFKARINALPAAAPPPAVEPLVEGLNARQWHDTARRFAAGLQTILRMEGDQIDHDWCRRQAAYYLGYAQPGIKVWAMPSGPDVFHIVVPDPMLALPRQKEAAP